MPISSHGFRVLDLERALARAFEIQPGPPPLPTDGAALVAQHLTRTCEAARHDRNTSVAM